GFAGSWALTTRARVLRMKVSCNLMGRVRPGRPGPACSPRAGWARVEGEKSLVPRSRGGRRSLGLEGQERRAQLGEVSLEGVEADAHVVELSVVRSHARAELGAQLFDGSAQRRLVREDLAVLT